ncbi:receptor kinase-like protein Xa21 [Cornus florida]|uniref:receptor kinase-like protein Xa21 n=1 Tax=Cornus florida TaxID=4283 RepID=UPI00289EF879|nr:receptor kinase-like protein Xa21 [Cornus florida]
MSNLISLEFLDLSGNNLSGDIPKSLEKLRYLQYLNVSFNRLQGEIPTGGCFNNFTAQSFMYNDVLCGVSRLQVPLCKTNALQRSKSKIVPILKYILPTIVASTILVLALLYVLIRREKDNSRLLNQVDSMPLAWRRISYHQLLQTRNSFNETNLLGKGSFGSIYGGTLSDGTNIAVKVFNLQSEAVFRSFDVECEVMRNIHHRNLTQSSTAARTWISKPCLGISTSWSFNSHSSHYDLKPSNVLLDENMIAHIADFGIAKLLGDGDFMAQTRTLATIGYMAPEYGTEGIVSTKGNVYNYGIMLMEVFTRKKPTDDMFAGEMSLKHWVKEALDDSPFTVLDANLIGREDKHYLVKEQCISSVLSLATDCSNDSPEKRINMNDALIVLKKIKTTFVANSGYA